MADNEKHMQWAHAAEQQLRQVIRDKSAEITRLQGVNAGLERAHKTAIAALKREHVAKLNAEQAAADGLRSELAELRAAIAQLQTELHGDQGKIAQLRRRT